MADSRNLIACLNSRAPATSAAIASFESASGKQLPRDYVEFLMTTDGAEGFVSNAYVILWTVDELASLNEGYEVEENAPGLLIFGSDGGGEAYGFDTRQTDWTIVQVPFVGMSWALAQPLAKSFRGFLEYLHTIQ